jgi:hypothetical protein
MMRLALLSMFAACGWAQLTFEIHPVTGRASDRLKEAERILRVAQRSPLRDAAAPEELAVLEGIGKTYRLNFLPGIDSVPRIATLTDKGKDILIARWTSDEDAFSELIVWDTPEDTSFIFKLPAHSWSSDAAIRGTFEKLLPAPDNKRWPHPASGVVLNVAKDVQTRQWIGAGGLRILLPPRDFDIGSGNSVDLWETTTANYLCVTFSPFITFGYPWKLRWTPERFPPLETRVGGWTKKRLLDELVPAGDAPRVHSPWQNMDRDRILARELIKRDLTGDQFLAILESRGRSDNGAVLQAVVDSDQVQRFADAIRKNLASDCWPDTKEGQHPFDILLRVKGIDFTDVALEVLRQHSNAAAARRYAIAHGAALPAAP